MGGDRFIDGLPNSFAELNAFQILRKIVQAGEQAEWVAQRRPCRLTEACRDSEPRLLPEFDHDPIFYFLDVDRQRSLSTGHGSHACGDLHRHLFVLPQSLRVQIAAVEFRHQGVGDVARSDVAVKNSSVHEFDYNPLHQRRRYVVAFYLSMNLYVKKQFWFKYPGILAALLCLAWVGLFAPNQVEAFQGASTPTGIVITVTYTDPMNVRSGPGTFYDIIGQLFPGDVRPALGISPGREWIQISYEGGVGWVYAPYVSVSGGELQVVEPPPTPQPLTTATIDPTLAAQFDQAPTQTRMPTFTPPPPLTVPQFTEATQPRAVTIPSGYFVIILGVFGLVGLFLSFLSRK